MNILIPMAGEGSRFFKEGYTIPKPLIDVEGKPMIQRVVENLKIKGKYIFLIKSDHIKKYKTLVTTLLDATNNNCEIIEVDQTTEGAPCTALLAKKLIDNEEDLLIANSDQLIDYSFENFYCLKSFSSVDAIVFCFNAMHPKWSFVKTNTKGAVVEVAEKNPISNIATCGIYWYRKGCEFVKYAEVMINKNIRVNNEFYIAPVYNELIQDNKILIPFFVDKMYGIGTPEDLNIYLNRKK